MQPDDEGFSETTEDKMHLLPAWFCGRMVEHEGRYALVLEGGVTVALRRIKMIHQDNAGRIWLDIEMMSMADAEMYLGNGGPQARPIIAATGDQHRASINAGTVMIAYELGDRLPYDVGN